VEVHQAQAIIDPDMYFGLALDYSTNFALLGTNTSPVPFKVSVGQPSPATQIISWPEDYAGSRWGLEYNDDLTGHVWRALPDSSPFTNTTTSGQRYFRARIK